MPDKIRVRTLRRNDWPVIEKLFGEKGACAGCWCMYWRSPVGGKKFEARKGEPNRNDFHELVTSGQVHGVLAFSGRDPVGWCSIGPRAEHRRLGGPEDFQDEINAVWSLTCFYIKRSHRRTGRVSELIGAAVDYARRGGAVLVEAYPVEPDAPSYRFMGFTPVFTRAGFTEVGTTSFRRHVMRLRLR